MLGHREWLQDHLGDLSDSQTEQLAAADQRVLDLLKTQASAATDDVRTLHFIADIINGKAVKKAA
jgi:hypothetical protein